MATKKSKFGFRLLFHILGTVGVVSLLLAYLSPFVHPSTSPLLSFLGLTYPVVLAFNLVLLLAFAIRRSRWTFILLGFILIGFKFHLRIFAMGSDPDPIAGESIKVLSYNVRLFDRYNNDRIAGDQNRRKIIRYLHQENPDILCFQEFYHQDKPTDFTTKDTLISLLGIKDHHELYRQSKWSYQNFGVCILSKFPMLTKGVITFDNSDDSNNFCVYADLLVHGDTIRFYNAHLQSIRLKPEDYSAFDEMTNSAKSNTKGMLGILKKIAQAFPIRAAQAEKISEHVKESPYPVVLCGDFNDTPMSYTYNRINSVLTDAHRNCNFGLGVTYAGKLPAGRIDYIFHSKTLESSQFRIQDEVLSDHRAIQCIISSKSED